METPAVNDGNVTRRHDIIWREIMKFVFRTKDNGAETNAACSEGRQLVRKCGITSYRKKLNSCSAQKSACSKAHNVFVNEGNVSGCKVQEPLENPFVTRKLIPDRRVTDATRSSHVRCTTAKCSRASRVFVCRQGAPVNNFRSHPPHSACCDPLVSDAQHPASTFGAEVYLPVGPPLH